MDRARFIVQDIARHYHRTPHAYHCRAKFRHSSQVSCTSAAAVHSCPTAARRGGARIGAAGRRRGGPVCAGSLHQTIGVSHLQRAAIFICQTGVPGAPRRVRTRAAR